MDDFGTYSDETEAKQISIKSLPTNGELQLDGVTISAGTIIDVSDIDDNKLVFIPNKDTDNDSSFTFQISDGALWSNTQTTNVEVTAIADAPTASINVTKITSSENSDDLIVKLGDKTFNISEILANKEDNTQFTPVGDFENNYYMQADKTQVRFSEGLGQNDNVHGTNNDDLIIVDGDIYGGANINSTDGNDIVLLLGDIQGGTFAGDNGTDYLYLGKNMDRYEISNYNGPEQGHPDMDFHLKDLDTGKTLIINNIEGVIFADGQTLGTVEKVENSTTAVEYEVDFSAALQDLDNSETLTVQISGVPIGASFDLSKLAPIGTPLI